MPVVLNKRTATSEQLKDAVYIGRPSVWGNPFVIGKDGDRTDVIEKYFHWLFAQPELLARAKELKGKDLVCWCKPYYCHGDILLQVANAT